MLLNQTHRSYQSNEQKNKQKFRKTEKNSEAGTTHVQSQAEFEDCKHLKIQEDNGLYHSDSILD